MELLSHFPYSMIRSFQKETLTLLEEKWNEYDVFVIVAPTAFGKTAISKTLLQSSYKASYIAPTNQLVDQFLAAFPDTSTLRRLDSYWCEDSQLPCPKVRAIKKGFCRGCTCGTELARAKYRNGPGVYTYHAYLAHRLYRDVLVVDEAHQLIPMLQSLGEVILWRHDYRYNNSSRDGLLKWIQSLPAKKRNGTKLSLLYNTLISRSPDYALSIETREFNGKGTKRGEPEERECLVLTPISVKEQGKKMWPHYVKKIVLMSATINFKDVEGLGLSDRKVAYLHSPSPIPPERRPFIAQPVCTVVWNNIEQSAREMANYVDKVLYPRHAGERGLLHVTYQMADILRNYLTGSQYLFHDRDNKKEVYQRYLSTKGAVLVACGMYEGIDLPDDAGRWQAILKVPWPSLGDAAISALATRDNEWYLWETAKKLIQAGGRVSRHEKDYGVTYCLDNSFMRLYNEGRHLLPKWFLDCLMNGGDNE